MKTDWDIPFRYIVLIFFLLLVLAVMWYVREVFQPLMTAGLMAYFLSPAVNFLVMRARIRRKVAANIVYFVFLALVIALPFTILPVLLDEIQGIMLDLNRALSELQVVLAEPLTIGNVTLFLGGLIPALRTSLSSDIVPDPEEALRALAIGSRNFLWLLVILVTGYYLMTEWERLRNWLIQWAPEEEQSNLNRLYHELRRVWVSYLGGQIRLIVVLAVLYSIAWVAIGLPGALVLGVLAGFLNLLPEVGPAGAAILATVVALLEGSNYFDIPHVWFGALTLGLYLLLNTFKTVWLQPRILGQSVLLHEALVFVAIITAIMLQGILGVLIVVPLLASIGVIARYIRRRLLGLPPFEREQTTPVNATREAGSQKNLPNTQSKPEDLNR
jgi:predicted PurR-regulated permease PerM